MVLIVGGMAQGKLEFAKRALGVTAWSEGVLGEESCVHGLHRALRALPDPEAAIGAWLEAHPDGVLICDEVGCGVTPADPRQRMAREQTGRLCAALASRAQKVVRVCCGVPIVIKE